MLNLLAVWRAHGIDDVLRRCWERGVVMVGQSAGAMCWFEWGITRSSGAARPAAGLGLIAGALSVRYHRDPDRRSRLLDQVAELGTTGYGVDDGAGILVCGARGLRRGQRPPGPRCLAGEPRRDRSRRRGPDGSTSLPSSRPAIDERPDDVSEMRKLRKAARRGAGSRR